MTLDAIEGIAIPGVDGSVVLIYPKYRKCRMLGDGRSEAWMEPKHTEIEALFEDGDTSRERTDELLGLGSPAAEFVRSVGKEFNIPSLRSAGAIKKYRDEINALAEQIRGADLLDKDAILWSCLRGSSHYACHVAGRFGYFSGHYLNDACVAVPCFVTAWEK